VEPADLRAVDRAWNLDNAEAIGAVQWLIAKVIAEIG
jgi:hypothetical protein